MADDRRLDVLVRLLALVRLEAVGHEVVAVLHIDELLGQRVPAAVRAQCMRLVVVAGQGRPSRSCVLIRHSSLVRVDLGSDGMPMKVMAAFGALPATIDAWVLTR